VVEKSTPGAVEVRHARTFPSFRMSSGIRGSLRRRRATRTSHIEPFQSYGLAARDCTGLRRGQPSGLAAWPTPRASVPPWLHPRRRHSRAERSGMPLRNQGRSLESGARKLLVPALCPRMGTKRMSARMPYYQRLTIFVSSIFP
jgi:hypothetical protein